MELIETDAGRSPYLSLDDAYKVDDVHDAHRRGDLETAIKHARVFTLTAVYQQVQQVKARDVIGD